MYNVQDAYDECDVYNVQDAYDECVTHEVYDARCALHDTYNECETLHTVHSAPCVRVSVANMACRGVVMLGLWHWKGTLHGTGQAPLDANVWFGLG